MNIQFDLLHPTKTSLWSRRQGTYFLSDEGDDAGSGLNRCRNSSSREAPLNRIFALAADLWSNNFVVVSSWLSSLCHLHSFDYKTIPWLQIPRLTFFAGLQIPWLKSSVTANTLTKKFSDYPFFSDLTIFFCGDISVTTFSLTGKYSDNPVMVWQGLKI